METTNQLRAGAFGRQSKGNERSIAEQLEDADNDAAEEGYDIVIRYNDKQTASRFRAANVVREDWLQLEADIVAGLLDVVVFWESSRGTREPEEWLRFLRICREHGILIRVTEQGGQWFDVKRRPRDWKTLAEDGLRNAYSSEEMSQRYRRTFRLGSAKGRPHGQCPFGYRRVFHDTTREFIEQVPDRESYTTATGHVWSPAGLVAEIFDMVLSGRWSLVEIARWLAAHEIPSPRLFRATVAGNAEQLERWAGTNWTDTTVRQLLLNEQCIGSRVFKGEVVKRDCWEPLVDSEVFWAVNNLLKLPARRKGVAGRGSAIHLLSFIAYCHCGSPLGWGGNGKQYPRYRCQGNGFGHRDGRKVLAPDVQHVSIAAAELDDFVTEWTLYYLSDPETAARLRAVSIDNAEAAAARAEAERGRAELADWEQKAIDGQISLEMYLAKKAKLEPSVVDAERRAVWTGLPKDILDMCGPDAAKKWRQLGVSGKRRVIKHAVRELVVFPTRRAGRRAVPAVERVRIA